MKKNTVLYYLLILLLACRSAEKKIELGGIKIQENSSCTFHTVINTTILQERQGFEMKDGSTTEITYQCTTKVDSAKNKTITIAFTSFRMVLDNNGRKESLDAGAARYSKKPAERLFDAFLTTTFSALYDSTGKLLKIEGYNDFKKKLDSIGAGDKQAMAVRERLLVNYNEDFFKSGLSKTASIVAGKRVLKEGDTWSETVKVPYLGKEVTTDFSLENIDNNTATIESASKTNLDQVDPNLPGTKINFNVSENSNYKIDITTGLLISSRSKLTIENAEQENLKIKIVNEQEINRIK